MLAALVVAPKVDPYIRANVWTVPKSEFGPRMLRVPMTIDFYDLKPALPSYLKDAGPMMRVINYGMGRVAVREVKD